MNDRILRSFLACQHREGMALADASDRVRLVALGGDPPRKYLADFRCKGLVETPGGEVVEAERFVVGLWFPDDYLRAADPFTVLTWLEPRAVFHPNIRPPFMCIGPIAPATFLTDLLFRCYEVITYGRVTVDERDALNLDACRWARRNLDRFPIDRRPLKRQTRDAAAPSDFAVATPEVTR